MTQKIYQQTDHEGFHIGTSIYDDWCESKGAYDVEAPVYDKKAERAKFNTETREWIIKTKEEWNSEPDPAGDTHE